jgi:hypothetical protein
VHNREAQPDQALPGGITVGQADPTLHDCLMTVVVATKVGSWFRPGIIKTDKKGL